ncbi:hypothetical protein [Chitinophaga sp. XS-30]|uniref:hypothetical protein n=1 Tax=Chitinophaga sp. XS-30 TaxID=2604421 RepID=UPI00352A3EE2
MRERRYSARTAASFPFYGVLVQPAFQYLISSIHSVELSVHGSERFQHRRFTGSFPLKSIRGGNTHHPISLRTGSKQLAIRRHERSNACYRLHRLPGKAEAPFPWYTITRQRGGIYRIGIGIDMYRRRSGHKFLLSKAWYTEKQYQRGNQAHFHIVYILSERWSNAFLTLP